MKKCLLTNELNEVFHGSYSTMVIVSQPDGQLQMARRDPPHLQVLGGVASQLENLVGEIRTSEREGCKLGGYV